MTERKLHSSKYCGFDIILRDSEDWKFQSVQSEHDDRLVCYTRFKSGNDKVKEVLEVYSGENYVLTSKTRSYSKCYNMDQIPKKYQTTKFLMQMCLKEELGKKNIEILEVND